MKQYFDNGWLCFESFPIGKFDLYIHFFVFVSSGHDFYPLVMRYFFLSCLISDSAFGFTADTNVEKKKLRAAVNSKHEVHQQKYTQINIITGW